MHAGILLAFVKKQITTTKTTGFESNLIVYFSYLIVFFDCTFTLFSLHDSFNAFEFRGETRTVKTVYICGTRINPIESSFKGRDVGLTDGRYIQFDVNPAEWENNLSPIESPTNAFDLEAELIESINERNLDISLNPMKEENNKMVHVNNPVVPTKVVSTDQIEANVVVRSDIDSSLVLNDPNEQCGASSMSVLNVEPQKNAIMASPISAIGSNVELPDPIVDATNHINQVNTIDDAQAPTSTMVNPILASSLNETMEENNSIIVEAPIVNETVVENDNNNNNNNNNNARKRKFSSSTNK